MSLAPQALPGGSRLFTPSSPSSTSATAARSVTSLPSKARSGADGIPPNQPQTASKQDSYTQAAETRYQINFKKKFTYGFATGGQAQRQKAERFSGKLSELVEQIKTPDRKQVACKILVGLANQKKDPTLAKNAQVVLETVWGQAEKTGDTQTIHRLHEAYQLNFTPNLRTLKELESTVVHTPAPPSRTASPAKPTAVASTQVAASSREDLLKQKANYKQKLQEHYEAAESSAKDRKRGQMGQALSVVGGLTVLGLSIVFPVALFGLMPVIAAFRLGSIYERDCQQNYRSNMEKVDKLEAKIKTIDAQLAKA